MIFLAIYFCFTFLTYKDYGATGDEWTERRAAQDLSRYLKSPTSYDSIINLNYNDKINVVYGHHPLVTKYQRSYQLVQNYFNFKGYYEWGHLLNLIFGSVLFIFTYALFYLHYKSLAKAIIPVIFLVSCARLFGDIPTNNKDVPFAIFYLISIFFIYVFLNQKQKGSAYLKIISLGIIFGITQTFRTVGFSIYFVYIFYFFYVEFIEGRKFSISKIADFVLELFIIVVFSLFVSMSIFPWLGSNFFANFFHLLLDAKSFQNWDDTIFFAGEFLFKADRPWYYLFTWIFITMPIYILALIGSSVFFGKKLFKNKLFAISSIAFLVNIALYLILQPVVYNGIRHFLFLIPIMVIISTTVLYKVIENRKAFVVISILISINIVSIGWNFVILHPYEYIYFNELVGGIRGASGKYELDYWGASYKEAAEWIVNNTDLTQKDFIYACNVDYAVDYYSGKKFFMTYGYPEYANYTICDSENEMKRNYTGKILYEVKRDGVILNTVREHEKTKF